MMKSASYDFDKDLKILEEFISQVLTDKFSNLSYQELLEIPWLTATGGLPSELTKELAA